MQIGYAGRWKVKLCPSHHAGLNTPETHHPDKLPEYCGQEAFEANRRLVAGKTVRLELGEQRRDRYGRLLACVYVEHLFVNAELIRLGYGQVSTYMVRCQPTRIISAITKSSAVSSRAPSRRGVVCGVDAWICTSHRYLPDRSLGIPLDFAD